MSAKQPHMCNSLSKFTDGITVVDFVLAYKPQKLSINTARRRKFLDILKDAGLKYEKDKSQKATHYVKIHVPEPILKDYCKFMKMQMPVMKLKNQDKIHHENTSSALEKLLPNCIARFLVRPENPEAEYHLLYEYSDNKPYLFEETKDYFFTTSIRIAVIDFILDRSSFTENLCDGDLRSSSYFEQDDEFQLKTSMLEKGQSESVCEGQKKSIGLRKLLQDEDKAGEHAFYAAFPLHDGCIKHTDATQSLRIRLLSSWASVRKCITYQPLDDIKEYFGVKVALYFTWVGFYTTMLVPAAIVGFICFLYGILTVSTNRISAEICSDSTTIMCPQCDRYCGYWYLNSTCTASKVAYIFDNEGTIFFSIFISIWAALYLKLWKRYFSRIQHRWGVLDYSSMAEPQRPEYSSRVQNCKRKEYNMHTKLEEPSPSFWTQKLPAFICSYSVVYILISMSVAAVFGIIVYRMSLKTLENFYGVGATVSGKVILYPLTTATINLLASTALAQVYNKVAQKMTDIEYRRTQTEYNESLSLKLFMFEFLNYYSSIFYIAFLKGKFPGYPRKYNRIFTLRQEECSTGGCMMELSIQLATIMMGKQFIATVKEYLIPFVKHKYKMFMIRYETRHTEHCSTTLSQNQMMWDNNLLSWKDLTLFKEYLKMVTQYGFITIFAVAFPPASLLALLNNMIETRIDARKFLEFYKRAVPERVRDLGMWYNVMQVITKVAVISNAFIIAFSSNITHRIIYKLLVNPNYTDEGFVNNTLAYFNTSHFEPAAQPDRTMYTNMTVEVCRYAEYRNPPGHNDPYGRSLLYWKILAVKLALMIIYQNLVGLVQVLVSWAIPDMPRHLQVQIKKEQYFINEYIIEQEKTK